jgi:hypothetical protein
MAGRSALHPQPTVAAQPVDGKAIPTRTELASGTPLGETERLVLARVNGSRTISDISGLLGLSTHEGGMVMARLAELGAVKVSESVALDIDWDHPSGSMQTVRPKTDDGD